MRLSPSVGTGAPREAERDQRREGGAKNEDEEEDGDTAYLDVLRHYDSQGATSVCAGACDRVKLGTGVLCLILLALLLGTRMNLSVVCILSLIHI